MNRSRKLGGASTLSMYTALMLAAFVLMHKLGTDTPGLGAGAYALIAAAAMVVSGAVTLITAMDGGMYDDYQISRLERISAVTGAASKGVIPLAAIVGIILDSVGFVVCAGMIAEWVLLFINAAAAMVIGHSK